jgi:hypothetical protein
MKLTSLLLAAAITAAPAYAGGPVIIEDEYTVEADTPRVGNALLLISGLIVACAILCGGDDDPAPVKPGPICLTGC